MPAISDVSVAEDLLSNEASLAAHCFSMMLSGEPMTSSTNML
jgi:hypothetical protein